MVENIWREENCEVVWESDCPTPDLCPEVCPNAWNCDDVLNVTEELMMKLDTNADG